MANRMREKGNSLRDSDGDYDGDRGNSRNRDQTKREGNSEPGRKQSAKATRDQDPASGSGRVRMGHNQARGDGVRKNAPRGYRGSY